MIRYFLIFILYLLMAFGIPYLIQYEWGFFGATQITVSDIIALWSSMPIISLFLILNIKRLWK